MIKLLRVTKLEKGGYLIVYRDCSGMGIAHNIFTYDLEAKLLELKQEKDVPHGKGIVLPSGK